MESDMGQQFAIITFRDTGPIKSWSDLRGANVHNSRLKPIEHGIEGAPPPRHLVGSPDLVADVKSKLGRAGIDPAKMRKNGVIAYEAVMTASPEFFEGADETKREKWIDAQVAFAIKRWGAHRVASMVLHLDEKTPHIHVVILPLEVKPDKRRTDPHAVRWSLVGRTISGPGKFDQLQDDYAAEMAPFGLVRGVKGSDRKHRPVVAFLAELAQREAGAERMRVVLDAARRDLVRDGEQLKAEREAHRTKAEEQVRRLREMDERMARGRAQLDADREAWEIEAKKRRKALVDFAERIERDRLAVVEERQAVARDAAANREFREKLVTTREALKPIVERANEFVIKARDIDVARLAPRAQDAVSAARRVVQAVRPAPQPSNDGPSLSQQAALMAQRGMGR
jgi:hypothetical protein